MCYTLVLADLTVLLDYFHPHSNVLVRFLFCERMLRAQCLLITNETCYSTTVKRLTL
jgi:hypothetical protein